MAKPKIVICMGSSCFARGNEKTVEAFGTQCGKFTKTICGICHDRFIIVDQKEIFWTGASLKDAGRLTFAAARKNHDAFISPVVRQLYRTEAA